MLRKITMSFIVIIVLNGCTLVNQLRLRNSNGHLEPIWSEGVSKTQLQADYDGEKPYVYATVNGVDGFKFLVDTGASVTILQDTPKVKALKLKRGFELALSGWGDEGESPAFQSELKRINLGEVSFEKINIAYLPISQTKYFLRADEAVYDGVLGHDVIRHFSWVFDKRSNQISIDSMPYQVPDKTTTLPIDLFFSKPYINAFIDLGNGQKFEHELIIDTGSRHYIKLNKVFLEDAKYQLPGSAITAADFGISGRAIHQRIVVPEIALGNLKFKRVKANIIQSDEDDDFWIVGSALLNQYISVVDYHSEKMHLIEYPESHFRTRFNLLGLELRKIRSGEFVVRYIFPDMDAYNLDIKVGDLITRINGQSSSNISLNQWLDITSTQQTHEVCIRREAEQCFTIIAQPVKGYSKP